MLLAVLTALIGGAVFRKDVRVTAAGAWRAGSSQAGREFRAGYSATRAGYVRAQRHLRRDHPGWKDPRRWAAALLKLAGWSAIAVGGTTYGAYRVTVGTARVARTAWQGGRDAYRTYKLTQPVDVEVTDPDDPVKVEQVLDQPDLDPDTQARAQADAQADSDSRRTPDPIPQPDPQHQPREDPDMTFDNQEAAGLASLRIVFATAAENAGNDVVAIDGIQADQLGKLAENGDIVSKIADVSETAALYEKQLTAVVDAIDALVNN
ncbi:hypothetical protein ACWEN6_14070 [Sphaerisporangium sp. NPDC004334]